MNANNQPWQVDPRPLYVAPPPADDRSWLHGFVTGAALPALQAVLTGVFLGLAALVLAWLAGSLDPWKWGIGVFVLSVASLWGLLLLRWLRLTRPLETIIGRDLDNDGYIGEPDHEPRRIRIELHQSSQGVHTGKFIDLPASEEQLSRLAQGLIGGAPFAESAWTGSTGVFSRSQFSQLRAELLRRGLIAWNSASRAQGVSLTPEGIAVFQALASGQSPTLPPQNTTRTV